MRPGVGEGRSALPGVQFLVQFQSSLKSAPVCVIAGFPVAETDIAQIRDGTCRSADIVVCLFTAILVMMVLLVLTPVFKYMPQNAQGAIVISAVFGLFNYTEWWFLFKVSCLETSGLLLPVIV